MPITFSETMQGTLYSTSLNGERDHAVSFTVTARHEGHGYFHLDGTAIAAPWAENVPATGMLRLSPGSLRYRVRCEGPAVRTASGEEAGRIWQIAGQKLPTALAPLRSMTVLPVTLVDPTGAVRATGDLRFEIRDLPSFALSWLPRPRSLPGSWVVT